MARRDHLSTRAMAQSLGGGIACLTSGGLQVPGPELWALNVHVDAQLRAQLPARPLVFRRLRSQPVVDVERVDLLGAERMGQGRGDARRVGAPRDEDHGPPSVDQPAGAHGARRAR